MAKFCKCGAITKVVDTRMRKDRLWRRRECPKCDIRFTTYELSVSDMAKIEEKLRRYEKIENIVEKGTSR